MPASSEPIQKVTLVDQIAGILRKEIFAGVFAPRGPFPSEKELAERFGASRITIRAALQALAKEDLIQISHGKGNIINNFREVAGVEVFPELLVAYPEGLITNEAIESYVRQLLWLHGEIFEAAAGKAKPDHARLLLDIVDEFSKELGPPAAREVQARYMRQLLAISGNIFLMMSYNTLYKASLRYLGYGFRDEINYPNKDYHNLFSILTEAICARNLAGVRECAKAIRPVAEADIRRLLEVIRRTAGQA